MSKINERIRYYLIYTALFSFLILISLSFVWFYHYSITFLGDDMRGHYQFLLYFHDYFRELFSNISDIKTFEYSLGYGNDIISTLSWAGIGEPLNLLAAFFSKENLEYLFWILIVIRTYISGIAFSVYARSKGNGQCAVLLGAMTYCFSGFVINACFHQSTFSDAVIFLPFVLLGADLLFEKNGGRLLSISVGLLCICNFYWLYMTVLILILYCVLYYISNETFCIRNLLRYIFRFIYHGIVGILIGSVMLLPVAMHMLESNRMNADVAVPVLYSYRYYVELLSHFFTTERNYSVYLGFSPIALISVIVLFFRYDRLKMMRRMFIILSVFLCIPYVAHVFNGFGYVSNRWTFAYSFFVAYAVTITFSVLQQLSGKEKYILFAVVIFYTTLCVLSRYSRTGWTMIELLFAALYVIVIVICSRRKAHLIKISAFVVLIAGLVVNICYTYPHTEENNPASQRYRLGECYEKAVEQNPAQIVKNIEDSSEYRVDSYNSIVVNQFFQQGLSSPNMYLSVNNFEVGKFYRDIEFNSSSDFYIDNLDGRSYLETLAGTKYFLIKNGEEQYLPYGFNKCIKKTEINGITYEVFENEYVLPYMFCYDKAIAYEQWIQMDTVSRQESLLDSVVIEDENIIGSYEGNRHSLKVNMTGSEGCDIKDNCIVVPEGNAVVTYQIELQGDEELYFQIEGLKYTEINHEEKDVAAINISAGNGVAKSMLYYTNENYAYCGRDSYLCNMGYINAGGTLDITVQLPEDGIYEFDKMGFVTQPMESYRQNTRHLQENKADNITFRKDCLSGTIDTKQDTWVFVSMPYSNGWKAYIDGDEVPVKKSNGMYMSVFAKAGSHRITFVYHTPWLKVGMVLSIIGILLLFLRRKVSILQV